MGVKVRQKAKGKGKPWWVFVSHHGRRTSKLVGDKAAAEEVASKIRAKLQLGEFGFEEEKAVTVSFLTLAFAQLWHVFNMRDKNSSIFDNAIVRNPFVWGALGLCTLLLAATVYIPILADVLHVVNPGTTGWLLILSMSLLPMIVGQIGLAIMKDRS